MIYFFGVVLVSSLIGGVVYLIGGIPKPTQAEIDPPLPNIAGGE